jgi:hypothetical protein
MYPRTLESRITSCASVGAAVVIATRESCSADEGAEGVYSVGEKEDGSYSEGECDR